MTSTRMSLAVVGRSVYVAAQVVRCAATVAGAYLGARRHGRDEAERVASAALATGIERLGPTYVKFGQLIASRPDALPRPVASALSSLHDHVSPMAADEFDQAWHAACTELPLLTRYNVDPVPIGAGSVACVYVVTDGYEALAVKLLRPRVRDHLEHDLALFESLASVAERLTSQNARVADLLGFMADALIGQVDLQREASHTERLRSALVDYIGVLVPEVVAASPSALVLEYVPNLPPAEPPSPEAARRAHRAIDHMVFRDGFVHCDLHPGNMYLMPDDTVVILDCGYSVQVGAAVRDHLADFFTALARGDGVTCGEIMFDTALNDGCAHGRSAFVEKVAALVRATTAERFDMAAFGRQIPQIQAAHGVHPPSEFAFPLMSLLVAEGTLRRGDAAIELPSSRLESVGVIAA